MPRAPRLVIAGQPHHVIVRGNNRRRLFSWHSDYRRFLYYLDRGLAQTGCTAHALAMMANHVHLVVTPPVDGAIAALVKSFAQRYAQYRNGRRDGSGKLFEQRYLCKPILDEAQLAITTVYCDLNPLGGAWLGDGQRLRWSTFGHHVGRPGESAIPARLWTPSGWYLGLGAAPAARVAAFLGWVDAALERRREGAFELGTADEAWGAELVGAPSGVDGGELDQPFAAAEVQSGGRVSPEESAGGRPEWFELHASNAPRQAHAPRRSRRAAVSGAVDYSLRLERPNRTRAREAGGSYRKESARVWLERQ
jgi:putative transposase